MHLYEVELPGMYLHVLFISGLSKCLGYIWVLAIQHLV